MIKMVVMIILMILIIHDGDHYHKLCYYLKLGVDIRFFQYAVSKVQLFIIIPEECEDEYFHQT